MDDKQKLLSTVIEMEDDEYRILAEKMLHERAKLEELLRGVVEKPEAH